VSVTQRLVALAEQLDPDERAVLLLIAERLTRGWQQYGTYRSALVPTQAFEEVADGRCAP
jgi:hypothetical protein